ncbi:MAG: F0F1 ATP synthase subunit A [Actinobacteria bacterium]|nr:MAG: F0F1 ATP synthase subunit A [Actinomycetota bacterium]
MKRLTLAAVALLALAVPSQAFAEDFHPEDEFQLHAWVPIHVGPLDLSINKAVAYLMLGTLLSILLGIVFMRVRIGVRPGVRQTVGEQIYEVAQTQIAEQGLPSKAIGLWFPYVATLLIFIWVLNMVGFIPLPLSDDKFHIGGLAVPTFGIYAATASLSVTLALSLMTWVFTHIEGVRFNGAFGYVKSLIPEVPRAMVVPIALIEFISVFMRLISLSVRLFANMLAGHMLILVMIGLVFVIHTPPWRFLGLPAALIFYAFEVVIVVSIQAFIFAALSAIYIGSAIEPEH